MTDATIVVESGAKGGAIITAEIANSYNKDVFAVPGRAGDEFSAGCNYLIKNNKAMLIESAADLAFNMGWEEKKMKSTEQRALFIELEEKEIPIVEMLKTKDSAVLDDIAFQINYSSSQLAATLLNLEFKGVVKALPGKVYKLVQ
jgi:DNA processing protein